MSNTSYFNGSGNCRTTQTQLRYRAPPNPGKRAPFIYSDEAQVQMAAIYRQYMQQAQQAQLPILLCSRTWRANQERVSASNIKSTINQDAVSFMREIQLPGEIKLGGMIGCKMIVIEQIKSCQLRKPNSSINGKLSNFAKPMWIT